jgi:hypothetical protein
MCNCVCQSSYAPRNQNQINFEFGYDPNSKGYKDGYNTGYTWDANWMPGGPHYFTASATDKPEWKKQCADSKRYYEEWHRGFNDGLNARLVENRHFARWWATNKGKSFTGKNIKQVRYLMIENREAKALDNVSCI